MRTIRNLTRPEILPIVIVVSYCLFWGLLLITGSERWEYLASLILVAYLMRWCASGGECNSLLRSTNLKGKVAIVTGSNSGIGFYTALLLGEMGATVVITCRTVNQTLQTASKLKALAKRRGIVRDSSLLDIRTGYTLELDNFTSIKSFAAQFATSELPLHFLINNAGMMVTNLHFSQFNPELEKTTAVNVLGPLLLTELMMPHLTKTSKEQKRLTRVLHVASEMHGSVGNDSTIRIGSGEVSRRFKCVNRGSEAASGYLASPSISFSFIRYGYSKLANVYTSHYCANVYPTETSGVLSCSLHPGRVITGFMNSLVCTIPDWLKDLMFKWFLKTPLEGAYTTIYACICPDTKIVRYVLRERVEGKAIPGASTIIETRDHFDEATTKSLSMPSEWKYISPYLVDCSDRTLSDLEAFGFSLRDAKEVIDWSLLEIRKRLGVTSQ